MAECKIPEIRLAVFGASASGKTTLLSSYFGNQQRDSFEKTYKYRLEADDILDGNLLLSRYYKMEEGTFPLGTEKFMEHSFSLKIAGLCTPCMRIRWLDYPGGWWERSPVDDFEKRERHMAFKKLLESHVGILLVDGIRYHMEGLPYVRHLLDQFKAEIRRTQDHLASENTPQSNFPKQWILAITKADQLPPDMSAEKICKEIISGAVDQVNGVAKAVNAKSFGHQYLLLSAVQGDGAKVVDAHQHIGLTLIAPVGLLAIFSEVIKTYPNGKLCRVLAYFCGALSEITDVVDKLDDFLPKRYQLLSLILKAADLKKGLENGREYFSKQREAAVKDGESLKAVANLMKEMMASDESKRVYFCSQGGDFDA